MEVKKEIGSYFPGRTLVSQTSEFGGARNVFVKLQGMKNELVFPPLGGQIKNPFKGAAKLYAGDLMEYRTDENGAKAEIYILKTYKVVSADSTTLTIVRDGYSHIPFVGDKLGKAPATIGGAVTGAQTITAVKATEKAGQKVWELTMGAAFTAAKDDILVEVDDSNKMMVKEINAVAPCDYDFCYNPAAASTNADTEFEAARYFVTPALGGLMYTKRMSALPACVLAKNESKVNGWFKIGGWGNF